MGVKVCVISICLKLYKYNVNVDKRSIGFIEIWIWIVGFRV